MDGRGPAVAAFEEPMELAALIAALSDPRAFGRAEGVRVEVVQTHVSVEFLIEDDVYKLKKPVDLEFLDYSTLSRRRHFCQLEVELNRRLAPDVYFLQGFSGHGVVLAGIAGKLVAEAVAGTAERFDLFTRIPHRGFPGGALLRRPALVLAMLYYRLRDLL